MDKGKVALGANLKLAYLPQNITFNREEDMVIECFRENRYILEGKAREYLSKFMFFGKSPYKKVKQLSGGERVRLKLSMLLYDEINLLILDEPTNHLDIDSMEILEEALEDFKGTILFISHDRYFINKISTRVVAIEERNFANYPGNYDYYKQKKDESRQSVTPALIIKKNNDNEKVTAANKNVESKMGIIDLESNIKRLEDEVRRINESMEASGVNHDELNVLYLKKEELNMELDQMIEKWMKI